MKRMVHLLRVLLRISPGMLLGLLSSPHFPRSALAIPPPCTEEELLETSNFAVEGYVVGVECQDPYESGECQPLPGAEDSFLPELFSVCTATVRVTECLKGEHAPGDDVEIQFVKRVRSCENGEMMIPGSPVKDFRVNSEIRYYDSLVCAFWNFTEIHPPFLRGDANADGEIDVTDAVRILLFLFVSGAEIPPSPALDADGDGATDVTDCVYLLGYLFRGGPAPPEPFSPVDREEVRLTLAYDNYSLDPATTPGLDPTLETDWGFSCLVETPEDEILLDTGDDGALLLRNLDKLDIRPLGIDRVFLSHIHNDHVGGTKAILARTSSIPVYIPASFPASLRQDVLFFGSVPIDVEGRRQICPRVFSSGELPGPPNEQGLLVETPLGSIVITACAHPGLVTVVEEAKEQLGSEVYLLLGGFHLFQMSDSEVLAIITEMRRLGVQKVAPCHCTGDRARALFRQEYGSDCIDVGVGARLSVRL